MLIKKSFSINEDEDNGQHLFTPSYHTATQKVFRRYTLTHARSLDISTLCCETAGALHQPCYNPIDVAVNRYQLHG
jgi:hypothetical protein